MELYDHFPMGSVGLAVTVQINRSIPIIEKGGVRRPEFSVHETDGSTGVYVLLFYRDESDAQPCLVYVGQTRDLGSRMGDYSLPAKVGGGKRSQSSAMAGRIVEWIDEGGAVMLGFALCDKFEVDGEAAVRNFNRENYRLLVEAATVELFMKKGYPMLNSSAGGV